MDKQDKPQVNVTPQRDSQPVSRETWQNCMCVLLEEARDRGRLDPCRAHLMVRRKQHALIWLGVIAAVVLSMIVSYCTRG